jgi:uncharacterized protein (DUF1778 family)
VFTVTSRLGSRVPGTAKNRREQPTVSPSVRGLDGHLDLSGRVPYTLLMASSSTKTRRIEIRITEEERDLEQAAAAASGETLSEFVRRAARHEAERTLAERTRYMLDDEAAQRFLTALEQPSFASERGLRRLIEKPSILPEA